MPSDRLPVIDVAPLARPDAAGAAGAAEQIAAACRDLGFFYAAGHLVRPETLSALEDASRRFFALPEERKAEVAMPRGGRAWRGWFPLGGELTSGRPDWKAGCYFGEELGPDDPRVAEGWPLHGGNLWPEDVPELKPAVLAYMGEAEASAHLVMEGIALSLGLERGWFRQAYTARPTLLFRIFHYPPEPPGFDGWGVGEHTDYGLLTLLAQDERGGLEVKTREGWIAAPPIPGTLVCNIGDMLDRLTGGFYRSTPHRARNRSGRDRFSFPFFFDPGFDAEITPLPERALRTIDDAADRWDRASVHAFEGTYGDYLLAKVSKVFPELAEGL